MKGLTYLVSRPADLGTVVGVCIKNIYNYNIEVSNKTLKDLTSEISVHLFFFLLKLSNHYSLFSIQNPPFL